MLESTVLTTPVGRAIIGLVLALAFQTSAAAQSCFTKQQCPDGYGCIKPSGQCDAVGECTELPPPKCPPVWDPVCGCSGVTYGNACEAHVAGWTIKYEGECNPDDFQCESGLDCLPGMYCKRSAGECTGTGQCTSPPEFCTDEWDPVCACDGNTYGNACEAAAAMVSVLHQDECDFKPCNGADSCPSGFYCEKAVGACNGTGECRAIEPPELGCPPVWMPVCGCDGITYGSDCETWHAGVSIAYEGKCNPSCAGDLNYDNAVGVTDLLILLGAWGPCHSCPADLTGDGAVGVADLLELLGKWGPCPS